MLENQVQSILYQDVNIIYMSLEDRVIADPTPGTTRDPISSYWVYKGQKIQLVDTAGIEPRPKIRHDLDL